MLIQICLSISKISHKNTNAVICSIKYIIMESINNQNIDSDVDAYIIEENGNKYLIFALTKKNKKVLGQYKKLWNEIKKQIEAINGAESIK